MRISDWSSDVCSSDLGAEPLDVDPGGGHGEALALGDPDIDRSGDCIGPVRRSEQRIEQGDIVLAVPVAVTHGGPAHPAILEAQLVAAVSRVLSPGLRGAPPPAASPPNPHPRRNSPVLGT